MSNMNEEGDEDRFGDAGRAQEKSSSILKASALFVIACALVALIGWSSSAAEPAEPLGEVLGDDLADGWYPAPPVVYASEDEERFKEALKPAAEREWDGIQCVQTDASAACKNGVPAFWLFVYGPYDGMDCESLAILKNVAEWQIEAAEPWRAHCRERPDAPHLPYPTVPAHDSIQQKVVCLSDAEEERVFDDWEVPEHIGFDLDRCSSQERVVKVVEEHSGLERPLCLGHSADTAVFDTLRFTLWDYYWLRGDIQAMWEYGDEDDWRELSESCSAQSRRLRPFSDNCPGRFVREANWEFGFVVSGIFTDKMHLHWHSKEETMRGLQFTPPLLADQFKPCRNPPRPTEEDQSGWARPWYKKGVTHQEEYDVSAWYCDKSPKTWVRIRGEFSGMITVPWKRWQGTPDEDEWCEYAKTGDKLRVFGNGSGGGSCRVDFQLPDPDPKKIRENKNVDRNVCTWL